MATTQVDKIKVSELSKFGFKVGNEFVNYSKQLPEADKTRVVPGAEFEAEMYVADSGKRYLNKIIAISVLPHVENKVATSESMAHQVPASNKNPAVDTERAKKFVPKFQKKEGGAESNAMSKDEWAAKDQRISRQGVIQAAVIALAPVVSLEFLSAEAVKLANTMLTFVNNK